MKLVAEKAEGADPEDPNEYRAQNIFWVPSEARWAHLKAHAHQPTIGQLVDGAMAGIERDNPALKGVLPKDYDRHADLKADFILANPPFNVSDWGGERLCEDKRWQYGAPSAGKAGLIESRAA